MDKKRVDKVRQPGAYFTVEAALLFPMILTVIFFVIYMMLFQYNRCLLDTDMASLTINACSDWTLTKREVDHRLTRRSSLLGEGIYYGWENVDISIVQKHNGVLAEGRGRLLLPAEDKWKAYVAYHTARVNPVQFVRSCEFVTSLAEDVKSAKRDEEEAGKGKESEEEK